MPNEMEHLPNSVPAVLGALEPNQLVAARKKPLPRRVLSPLESLTLWFLRIYLLAVAGTLIYQVLGR